MSDTHFCLQRNSDHVWAMLLWQRRPCRPQPGQRSELWSRSLWPSWRSAESGSSPALWGPPGVMGQTVRQRRLGSLSLHLGKKKQQLHRPPTVGWPCWNGMISRCHRPLGYLLLYLKLCKKNVFDCSKDATTQYIWQLQHMHPIVWCCPYPRRSRCPGEGWQRAVWRFPRSHSLWTWGSSELNGSGRIPSHHHVLHSWCSYPGDRITWFNLYSESTNKDSVLFKLLPYHGQIVVLSSVPKGKNLFLLSWHAHQHAVKDVIVSFLRCLHIKVHVRYHKRIWLVPCYCSCKHSPKQSSHLTTNSGLFQQVLLNASPFDGPTLGEVDVNVLPKTTGVIISNCFGVAKGWEGNYTYFIKADQVKKGDSANYDGCLIILCKLIPSKMGFDSRICCSIQECWPLTAARNCSMSLVLSVFPAPDSPLMGKSKE